ncbi:MAG: hypothetical protein V4634_20180 [Pseudomonadota bacterium]
MDTNIYSPPGSILNVKDLPDLDGNALNSTDYYVVSKRKYFLLFFATVGMYEFFWFYKNWKLHKIRTGESSWPVMRAIFSIFFAHSLFEAVDRSLRASGKEFSWDPRATATGFVLLQIASSILDRLSSKNVGSPYTDLLSLALLPLLAWRIYIAQQAINIACGQPNGESNSKLSIANFIWLGLGLIFWVLMIIGLVRG